MCFILSVLRRLDYSAAIQELFSFLGIETKQKYAFLTFFVLKAKKTQKVRNLEQNLTKKRALSVFSYFAQGSMKWDKFYFNQIKVGFLDTFNFILFRCVPGWVFMIYVQ